MKQDYKVDGPGIVKFLKSRKVVLENRNNEMIMDLLLLWFLVAMIFLSGLIIVGLIISLFMGCKISIVDTSQSDLDKDKCK